MINVRFIKETDYVASGNVGRKGINLQVVDDALLTAGIWIDSDFIDVCVLDFTGKVVA
ncbi:hypothetical protein NK118_14365 [Lachnospiraceae bacterium PAL227]|uniref:Uncharacterized protein n=1 Tax=Ohessyouella blattaphilus TaxID=2949333 RepID=A0ABT1EL44_9FIRM|nr:hypothetical protein [Ohessyouella blattaphilus]MCP1111434.1 hypothetical protein [Ohessyouella blattaphilus]MCR8564828.1 hypothetical protein [Ohessyouella blattaphilus]